MGTFLLCSSKSVMFSVVRRHLATGASQLKPLSDRVLVVRLKPAEKTIGGIVLPESAQSKINRAEVVAVGPGRKDMNGQTVPMSVQVGDNVLLSESFNGTDVTLDGREYTLYREEDI